MEPLEAGMWVQTSMQMQDNHNGLLVQARGCQVVIDLITKLHGMAAN